MAPDTKGNSRMDIKTAKEDFYGETEWFMKETFT